MNMNQYTGSSHELLPGDVCSSGYRGQIPPLQSSQRREAKGQCGPARGAQSVRVAETSPECQKREPVVACAAGTTLPLDGEVLAGIVAWVVRAGMVSNGGPDDRGKPCIVLGKKVAEGRMNKPEAKRCKGSDKSVVAMMSRVMRGEMCGLGLPHIRRRAKSEAPAKGFGIGWSRKQDARNTGGISDARGHFTDTDLPPSKIVEGGSGRHRPVKKPLEKKTDEIPWGTTWS